MVRDEWEDLEPVAEETATTSICPQCGTFTGEGASRCPNCEKLLSDEVGLGGSTCDDEGDGSGQDLAKTEAEIKPPGVLLSAGGEVLTVLFDLRRVSTCLVGERLVRMPYADTPD